MEWNEMIDMFCISVLAEVVGRFSGQSIRWAKKKEDKERENRVFLFITKLAQWLDERNIQWAPITLHLRKGDEVKSRAASSASINAAANAYQHGLRVMGRGSSPRLVFRGAKMIDTHCTFVALPLLTVVIRVSNCISTLNRVELWQRNDGFRRDIREGAVHSRLRLYSVWILR